MLHANVEAEPKPVPRGQRAFEGLLDAGDTVIIDVGESHDMRSGATLRIDPAVLGDEAESRNSETVDSVLLLRSQPPAYPGEMRRSGKTRTQDLAVDIGKDTGEIGDRRVRVDDLLGIGINGRRREAGRQDDAVTIDDVAAADRLRRRLRRECPGR